VAFLPLHLACRHTRAPDRSTIKEIDRMDRTPPPVPPRNYLMWAILSIIAGFWPFGIVATVYANRSTSLVASGQIGAATEASRKALRWMIASFLTLPLCLALMIGYALIARGMA